MWGSSVPGRSRFPRCWPLGHEGPGGKESPGLSIFLTLYPPVCAVPLQQTPDILAPLPGPVFSELYAGDWGGADQRGHLLHLPAQGSATPGSHQGPALARGEYEEGTRTLG